MSTKEQRIEVFKDTLAMISEDQDLNKAVEYSKKHTKVFYENEYPSFNAGRTHLMMKVDVTRSRSYEAVQRLSKEYPKAKIAVLNFANAFHPGGGVASGSSAQEECLCRTSTLYPLLDRKTLQNDFYGYHKKLNALQATDALIYTEDVVVCKSDEDLPVRLKKEQWVKTDVITCAAPDLRNSTSWLGALTGGGVKMVNAELFGYHVKRAMHILTCAAHYNVDVLVLGAFGCGAFQNDPETVAKAYKTALEQFPHVFKKVEFAVYCAPGDDTNYKVFRKVLD